MNIVLPTLSKK